MFAIILENEFPALKDLPAVLQSWLDLWGKAAIVLLIIVEIWRQVSGRGSMVTHGLSGRLWNLPPSQGWKLRTFWLLLMAIGGGIGVGLILGLVDTDEIEDESKRKEK